MKQNKGTTKKKTVTPRTLQAIENMVENGGVVSAAMRSAGFSAAYSKNPQKFLATKQFAELATILLPDIKVLATHRQLLDAHRLDHMIFPLGPKTEEEQADSEDEDTEPIEEFLQKERTTMTDAEITTMLAEVSCTVRRIVHGNTARHVYFWAPDNKARQAASELAYKVKDKMRPTEAPRVQVDIKVDRNAYR